MSKPTLTDFIEITALIRWLEEIENAIQKIPAGDKHFAAQVYALDQTWSLLQRVKWLYTNAPKNPTPTQPFELIA